MFNHEELYWSPIESLLATSCLLFYFLFFLICASLFLTLIFERMVGWIQFLMTVSSFSILNMPSHCILASTVCDAKSAVNLTKSLFHMMSCFPFAAFKIFSFITFTVVRLVWIYLYLFYLDFNEPQVQIIHFIKYVGHFSAIISFNGFSALFSLLYFHGSHNFKWRDSFLWPFTSTLEPFYWIFQLLDFQCHYFDCTFL